MVVRLSKEKEGVEVEYLVREVLGRWGCGLSCCGFLESKTEEGSK